VVEVLVDELMWAFLFNLINISHSMYVSIFRDCRSGGHIKPNPNILAWNLSSFFTLNGIDNMQAY